MKIKIMYLLLATFLFSSCGAFKNSMSIKDVKELQEKSRQDKMNE